MLLSNVSVVNGQGPVAMLISNGKIVARGKAGLQNSSEHPAIHFKDAIAFPGLINSHDHLDFNCFSPLGTRKYDNYTEWGNDIHARYKPAINAVLKIPQLLRARWGMYKNLLAGVTTVVNHGETLAIADPLINVYQQAQSLHSVAFQQNWKWKLNDPLLASKVCVIHTGEGTDLRSAAEIDALLKWNLLRRKLVGVHGVAMNARQAKGFTGLVWCPESNKVLLGRQADIAALKTNTTLLFGTDSTLTGNWDIWQHTRLARSLQVVADAELFTMLTSSAAKLWGLNSGILRDGKDADIVIARTKNGVAGWDDFFSIGPENILLVLHRGEIRLFDETLLPQIRPQADLSSFSQVNVNGTTKFVAGDLPALQDAIRRYHPQVSFPADLCNTTKNTLSC